MQRPRGMDHPFRGQGPILLLLVPFLGGFAAGLTAGPACSSLALLAALAAILFAALRPRAAATACAVMALCGILSAGRIAAPDPEAARPFLDGECVLQGWVEEVRATDEGSSGVASEAVVSTLDGRAAIRFGRVSFSVRKPELPIRAGSEVRATGRLSPCVGRGNPGEFPRELTALAQGVRYAFSTQADRAVFLPPRAGGGGLRDLFRRSRETTRDWIARAAGRTDGALYLTALATGDVPSPSHPMVALLRKTGLAHLLAISGINVVIFHLVMAGLLRVVLWAARRRHGTPDLNRVSVLAALPASWCYAFLAGAPVSALRSAGMLTVGTLVWCLLGARGAGLAWTSLFFATAVAAPALAVSPSFLLSYAASFFLVASFAGTRPRRTGEGVLAVARHRIRGAFAASAVAFLGTLPVSGAFFSHVPAGAVLWNLLFGPVLGTAGVAGAALAVAGGALSLDRLAGPVDLAARGLTAALALLDRISGSGWGYLPIPPSGLHVALPFTLAAAVGSVALARRGKAPLAAVLASAIGFLAWIHLPYAALPDHRLALTALNPRQGAVHLVSFPGGGHAVIDCGSELRGDSGRRLLSPLLRSRGIRRVDLLVLTHPHEDHYGGARALLEEFDVGEIWIPSGAAPEAFGEAVSRRAERIRGRKAGDRFLKGGAELLVRGGGKGPKLPKTNEESLVLELRYGNVSFWLPGDVEEGAAAWGPAGPNRSSRTVLFLPHHGSPRADPAGWVRAARPELVVTQNRNCLGAENLLPSAHSILLENGAFTIRSDGRSCSVERAVGPAFLRLAGGFPTGDPGP